MEEDVEHKGDGHILIDMQFMSDIKVMKLRRKDIKF